MSVKDSDTIIHENVDIDMSPFGKLYFDWQKENPGQLIALLNLKRFYYSFYLNSEEVSGVEIRNNKNMYGYPGKVAKIMEDEWTYFYQDNALHFFFKLEADKIKAILLR